MISYKKGFEMVWHRYLGIPYTLHIYRRSRVKKAKATLVFLHGIGNSGKTWDAVSEGLPNDINVVIVDLLGFGDSPQPAWAVYDAKTQARSVAKTLLSIGAYKNIILIGHSMGCLVAVEYAKRYPTMVQSLVLCSPPIYNLDKHTNKKLFFERDYQLRKLYEFALKKPENIVTLSRLAKAAKLLNPGFSIEKLNAHIYVAALKANILSQTTPHDIVELTQPIHIFYGTLDPFVIGENIETAAKQSPTIARTRFIGGHEVVGKYVSRVTAHINKQLGSA